jgi:ketosteroid isomerase-like protein
MSQANVEAVRASFEAYARGDYVQASAYLADDVVWEVGQELPARGPGAVRELWRRWDSDWSELEVAAEDWIDVGDCVVVAIRYRGCGRASGVMVDDLWYGVHRFRGDRCVRKVDYRTREEALAAAQAGA